MWGLGTEQDLIYQEEHRTTQSQLIQSARKVDKRLLVQGEFAKGALSKTFAHLDNMEKDMDLIKEEANYGKMDVKKKEK